jgi:hypothetical protein
MGRGISAWSSPAPGISTKAWLERWLASRISLRASTWRGYAAHVRGYLNLYLGRIPLAELAPANVQAMSAAIAGGHAAGRPMGPVTLRRIHATLRAALNAAVHAGLITSNPGRWVELPSAARPRPQVWTPAAVDRWQAEGWRPVVAVWTPVQTAGFLRSVQGHRLYALFHLVALRGCGAVRSAVCAGATSTSAREPWRETGYVFTTPTGTPLPPDGLTRLFRRLVRESGLPPVTLHGLRHGAATLAQGRGPQDDRRPTRPLQHRVARRHLPQRRHRTGPGHRRRHRAANPVRRETPTRRAQATQPRRTTAGHHHRLTIPSRAHRQPGGAHPVPARRAQEQTTSTRFASRACEPPRRPRKKSPRS